MHDKVGAGISELRHWYHSIAKGLSYLQLSKLIDQLYQSQYIRDTIVVYEIDLRVILNTPIQKYLEKLKTWFTPGLARAGD